MTEFQINIILFLGFVIVWLWPALIIIGRVTWTKYTSDWQNWQDPINKQDYFRILIPPFFIWLNFARPSDLIGVTINKVEMKADLIKWGINIAYFLPVICIGLLWLM